MMAMGVSDVPPRRLNSAASLAGPSRLSRVSGGTLPPPLAEGKVVGPVFSVEEFHAMMVAEYGFQAPLFSDEEFRALMLEYEAQAALFSPDEFLAMMSAEDEIQAPLLPVVAPCPDHQERSKKRKPPPSTEDAESRAPPSKRSKKSRRKSKRKPPSPRTQNKMVATRILNKRIRAPEPSRGRTVLWCQCEKLPRDSPGCALHQAASERSWMTAQGHIPTVGDVGEVLVPKLSPHNRRKLVKLVNQYMRWRSSVWMPSRFFVERAQEDRALQDDCLMLTV